jgi:hypothetical protein
MQFGKLHIDPSRNPAVLDTATWDPAGAWQIVAGQPAGAWLALSAAINQQAARPALNSITLHAASLARWQDSTFCLASLADGQQILLELGAGQGQSVLGEPIGRLALEDGGSAQLLAYRADLDTVVRYGQSIDPDKAPHVMGAESRLGIGSRMTTASWPGIFRAMCTGGFSANAIQNSVREANLLEDLLAGRPAELNYGPNLGAFASGHAGSSFEGLWLYGVLEALKAQGPIRYGADADHMQVKRGAGRLERAKRVLESVRHYTFYTMDVSDILDYRALQAGQPAALEFLALKIPDDRVRWEVLSYHGQAQHIAGKTLSLDEAAVGRFVGKYWDAMAAMKELSEHVRQLKQGQPFDLEFAIDEVPPEMTACECVTSDEEVLFLIRECRRRDIPLTHIAPNIGVEKEMDYRCPDGKAGLEERIRYQTEMARELGLMFDFHSGDDLSPATRRVIGRATRGFNQFKVSPSLQLLFAETLEDVQPDVFRIWWDDTLAFAHSAAASGSSLARIGLQRLEASDAPAPSARHTVFRHYCFASVGRRDEAGQFVHRERLYDLSPAFQREYEERLVRFLGEIADDLFHQ